MEWNAKLVTGNALLDEQHRSLFRCLHDLEMATAESRTLFAVYTLTRLKHYVNEHFSAEEAMLSAANYPRLEQHLLEHETFRKRLHELQISAVHLDISAEVVAFLREWLIRHIAKSDMDYVSYIKP